MRANRGRHRYLLRVEELSPADSDVGAARPSWSLYTKIYAGRREFQTATERFGTGREHAKRITTWETNWRDDITESMSLVDGVDRYNIKGVRDPAGDRRLLVIDTELNVEGDFD